MGSGASVSQNLLEEIETEVNLLTPHLPVAELLNGGIIRLTGIYGFFNVDSLLEASWLKGKITLDEYRAAIKHINTCAVRSQANFPRFISYIDLSPRERAKAESGAAAVAEINQRHRSVHFTYQQGIKEMRVYAVWHPRLFSNIIMLSDGSTRKGPESYIHINVN